MLLACLILSQANPAWSQINVKLRANTATSPDTLSENHVVQIRGELRGTGSLPSGESVTWDENSGLVMTNVGGDYWEANFQMTPGDSLIFKFWTGFNNTTGTLFWDGWEGPISDGFNDNRLLIAGTSDTTLALQYIHNKETGVGQYWRPFETYPDSIAVYFRVNMGGITESGNFNPDVDGPVAMRGGPPFTPEGFGWDNHNVILTRELGSADGGGFWSGVGYISTDSVAAGATQTFKFVYDQSGSVIWESTPDRTFPYTSGLVNVTQDTTIHWVYYNNRRPTGAAIQQFNLSFKLDITALEKLGFFDSNLGDRIVVDGAKGWDLETLALPMTFQPLLQNWLAQDVFMTQPGAGIDFKYVIRWDSSRVDTTSPNYIPGTGGMDFWEEASVTGGGNRNYVFGDAQTQEVQGDFGRTFQFFNGLQPEGVIETPVGVTFNIDMVNATNPDSNASNPLFRAGIDTVYVKFEASFLALSQGMSFWGDDNEIVLEDPDGDLIYTGTIDLAPPTVFQASYRVGYTSESGDILNGGGLAFGRRSYQFVHPERIEADGTVVWPAAFVFPVAPWRDALLLVENPPDLTTPTSVEGDGISVDGYALHPAYPNPFNPSTTISYQLPKSSRIDVSVFNVSGQLVKTIFSGAQEAGHHSVQWDGTNKQGAGVSSGIYLIRLDAPDFSHTRKVMLVR
jgi:hypothetical protein